MSQPKPNRDQEIMWNEQSGPRWVAMQREMDAQLEPFGVAVADALAISSEQRVLDVGCGAGATSLMLAKRAREVVGLDISEPLLERARERAKGIANLRFERADAQTFAFSSDFDAVFSRFGVMFFDDSVAAFRNLRSALAEGGKLGFVCWRPMSENPAFTLPLQAGLPFLPEPPKPFDPNAPGPFAFADANKVRGILEQAGFTSVDLNPLDVELVFGGRADLEGAVDLALQIGPLARALGNAPQETVTRIRAAVAEALRPHHGPSGVALPSATWIVTARR